MLSEKQAAIYAFPYQGYDALICDGAVRSGKTANMAIAFVLWAMGNFSDRSFAFCGKSVASVERNVVQPVLSTGYLRQNFKMTFNRSSHCLTVRRGNKVNRIYLFGGKDESSYMLIQGITLAGVLLDEVALMPRSFVDQALARCSVQGARMWFNCNPAGYMHWFNQEWILQPEKHNVLHLHFTLDDNPGLDERTKERYRNSFTGIFYQRYILGEWVNAEGLVYDMFDRDRHIVDALPELSSFDTYVSSDFGTQNATVFLLIQKSLNSDAWYVTREYYYSGRDEKRQKTVGEYVDDLKRWLGDSRPQKVIVDPSALPLITELRKNGLAVMAANNEVMNGILDVQTMLATDRLFIHKNCKHTIDEFSIYAWNPDRDDEVIKENDHAMDALRYLVRTRRLVRLRD